MQLVNISCFQLVFHFLFHDNYTNYMKQVAMLYHLTFQEVHTHRRKEVESNHHGAE